MPPGTPTWPRAEHMHRYLAGYVATRDLGTVRLGTEVLAATPTDSGLGERLPKGGRVSAEFSCIERLVDGESAGDEADNGIGLGR